MNTSKSTMVGYLHIIVKWRKMILTNFLVISVLAAALSLCMPKTFTARTTILGPSEDESGPGLSSLLSSLPIPNLGLGNVSEATYTFIAIVNSRTVMEKIARRFNLVDRYGADNLEQAVRALRENVEAEINEDLTISLTASAATGFFARETEENQTRQLARDMANAFVQELDEINKKLKTEKARNHRIFIEKRYLQNLDDLENAENALKAFQETSGIIALPEQTEATIQAAADLKAQIVAKEVEIAVMAKYVSRSHQQLSRAKREVSELKRKLDQMKQGEAANGYNDTKDKSNARLFLPMNQAPEIGMQYLRLFREVALQQKILEFLLPQYEQAKIQEAKDTPTVQVLDQAVTPIKRKSPKRSLIVLLSGFVAIMLSIIAVLTIEYMRHLETLQNSDHEKLTQIVSALRGDLKRLMFRK